MRRLGNFWNAINLISAARDLAVETRRFQWDVSIPNTFYLDAEHADIRLSWHDGLQVLAKLELQAGFGWQWTTDQDVAGVYVVVKRKPLIGSIGRGKFAFTLPRGVHISLKLDHCQLCCDGLQTSLDLPPFQ